MNGEHEPGRGGTEPPAVVRRIHADELPGWWSKTLVIRPGQQGIVVRKGDTSVLPPPGARIGGFFGSGPDDAALVEVAELTLHPVVDGLLSADDQLVEADCLVRVRVQDPAGLYRALGVGRDRLTVGEVEGRVGADVRSRLAKAVRQYAAEDLCGSDATAQRIGADVRGFLTDSLESIGLGVDAVSHLGFVRAEDAVRRADALRLLRDRLRQTDTRARLAAVHDEREFADAVKQLEHEYGLRDELRQGEQAEATGEQVESPQGEAGIAPAPAGQAPPAGAGPAPTATSDGAAPGSPLLPVVAVGLTAGLAAEPDRVDRLVERIEQRLDTQQEQLTARFEHLLKQVGYAEPRDTAAAAIHHINTGVSLLRIVGAIVIPGAPVASFLWAGVVGNKTMPWLYIVLGGCALAVLAFVASFWLSDRARGQRQTVQSQRERDRLSPERRGAAERMVRERIAGSLERAASNLQEAQARAFRAGQVAVSGSLRELRRSAETLRDEVQSASFSGPALLKGRMLAPADLQSLLPMEDGLLEKSQDLADISEALHQQMVEGRAADVEISRQRLEGGLQGLRNRLIQRSAFLKGV